MVLIVDDKMMTFGSSQTNEREKCVTQYAKISCKKKKKEKKNYHNPKFIAREGSSKVEHHEKESR